MSKKYVKWFMLLALIVPLFLVACGGTPEEAVQDAIDTAEEAVPGITETAESVAEDVTEAAEDAAEQAEDAAEEVMEEAEATPEEAEEEMAEEEMAEEEMEACAPASDGTFAGVDPRGQTVVWWHNHSGSREELLNEIIADYNETNECGITLEALNQGGYNDIRDAVNASVASG
jgi:uncharacterized protein YyaL (SSP411 family)